MSLEEILRDIKDRRNARRTAILDRRSRPSEWVDKLGDNLARIAGHKWNWNDHDGLPVREDVLELIVGLFSNKGTVLSEGLLLGHLPDPILVLEPDGTVSLCLGNDSDRRMSIRFQCAGIVTYIKNWEDCETVETGVIRFSDPDSIAALCDLLDWIATN